MSMEKKAHGKHANQPHPNAQQGGARQDQPQRGRDTRNSNTAGPNRKQAPAREDSEAGVDMPGALRPPADS
jgi:hypothetical protein